jgi:hypothetical protein
MVIKIQFGLYLSFLEGWFPMIKSLQNLVMLLHSRIALERIAQWMKILRTWGPPISLKKAFGWNLVPWSLVSSFQKTCKVCVTYEEFWPIFNWKLSRLKVFKFLWSNGIMNETPNCLVTSSFDFANFIHPLSHLFQPFQLPTFQSIVQLSKLFTTFYTSWHLK